MFSSLSTLSSRTSCSSMSNATTEIRSAIQNQNFEGQIPLTSKKEVERKLASILIQVQQNQIKCISLTPATLGRFYDLAHTLNGYGESAVISLAILKNGVLASGSGAPENAIKLWDLSSRSCLSTLQGHTGSVFTLTVLPNGQLASGSWDKTIKLWDLSSHSCLSTLQGHINGIYALAALPNGRLASGSWDRTIKLWDLSSHYCLSTLQGHANGIYALAALPNGHLASGSDDTTIKLWDLPSGSCLSRLQRNTSTVYALAVLPNGQLASGSMDNTIKLWDLSSQSCLATLQGHTNSILALAVLPDGQLASGSRDTTIKIWDLASRSCLSTLQGHTDAVWALAALPNGLLASGSWDSTIKIWGSTTLSTKQLPSILNALKNNASVTALDLSYNPNIKDDIIDPLIKIFKKSGFFSFFGLKSNTTLKTIDLRRTGVSKKGVKKLEEAIQRQQSSIEVLADCPIEWKMVYFLIIFCRANRNSPFADSGLDLCKYSELGSFLDVPSGFFAPPHKSSSSKKFALLLNSPS